MKGTIKKIIFIVGYVLLSAITVHASTFDTQGNVLQPTDFIGSTSGGALRIKINNVLKAQFDIDGLRFLQPLAWFSDSNGQVFLDHLTGGGTALFAFNGTRMVNLTANGVEIVGPLIAKTKYTIAPNTAYTLTATDETVEMESGDFLVPQATPANAGKRYTMINTGGGEIPVHTMAGEMIGNYVQEGQYIIPSDFSVTIESNGSLWRVLK